MPAPEPDVDLKKIIIKMAPYYHKPNKSPQKSGDRVDFLALIPGF